MRTAAWADIIAELQTLYCGFVIDQPVGNNAFSYAQRRHKGIYVPALQTAGPETLGVGAEVVFREMDDGLEHACYGLNHFAYFSLGNKHFFVFDNHNHAYVFWIAAGMGGIFPFAARLLHIDQHSDMRQPPELPDKSDMPAVGPLKKAFDYAQKQLNVGNFIQPALHLGLFSAVAILDNSAAFEQSPPVAPVLDLDLDIFSRDMAYIPLEKRVRVIRRAIQQAELITIATSPYFIGQEEALFWLQRILAETDQQK